MSFSEAEVSVLSWWDDMDEYYCVGYKGLERHTKMDREDLKPIIAGLKQKGFLEYHKGLMNEDGLMGGAGWSITRAAIEAYSEWHEQVNDLQASDSADSLRPSKAQSDPNTGGIR